MKIIIMGAFGRGITALNMLTPEHQVIAFFDVDPLWVGKTLMGIPVYSEVPDSPYYAGIKNLDYDYIVIASVASDKIKRRLIDREGVDPDRILDIYNNGILDVRVGTLKFIADEIHSKMANNGSGGGGRLPNLVFGAVILQSISTFFFLIESFICLTPLRVSMNVTSSL